jgi:hypothetical protein
MRRRLAHAIVNQRASGIGGAKIAAISIQLHIQVRSEQQACWVEQRARGFQIVDEIDDLRRPGRRTPVSRAPGLDVEVGANQPINSLYRRGRGGDNQCRQQK